MNEWVLQDFSFGEIPCQLIEFTIENHVYVMVFNKVDATRTEEMISEKAADLGVEYRQNSYEVKFDLKENFDSDNFFMPSSVQLSVTATRNLGIIIKELLDFHYRNSNAEVYICVAESKKLKRFYDRLAKMYADELKFKVIQGLGEEGLGYEIRTPSYKSQSC